MQKQKQKLYLDSGYLNFDYLVNLPVDFIYVVGGRATGKTYGALAWLKEHNMLYTYMRRTQTQLDMVTNPFFSPFKPINEDYGCNIQPLPIAKGCCALYNCDEDGKPETGEPLGFTCALSTVANLRGFNIEEVKITIFDEFIGENHERPIKGEAGAFYNAYETINRNRELKGKPALKMICLANSNNIANPIFMDLELVNIAQTMQDKNQEVRILEDKNCAIVMLFNSPISKLKTDTALYRMTKNSAFYKMAISNDFGQAYSNIGSKRLIEYKPIVNVGELTIYKHKSKDTYYCTTHASGACPRYTAAERDLKLFNNNFVWLRISYYLSNTICFESPICEVLLDKYFHEGSKK